MDNSEDTNGYLVAVYGMICRILYLTTIRDVVPLQFTSTGNILSLTMFHNLFWSWMWFLVFYSFLDHITLLLLLLFPLNAIVFLLLPALALDAKISLFGFFYLAIGYSIR